MHAPCRPAHRQWWGCATVASLARLLTESPHSNREVSIMAATGVCAALTLFWISVSASSAAMAPGSQGVLAVRSWASSHRAYAAPFRTRTLASSGTTSTNVGASLGRGGGGASAAPVVAAAAVAPAKVPAAVPALPALLAEAAGAVLATAALHTPSVLQ